MVVPATVYMVLRFSREGLEGIPLFLVSNEDKLKLCLELPRRSIGRSSHIIQKLGASVEGLLSYLENTTDTPTDGHCPPMAP